MKTYIGTTIIADVLGVTKAAVSNWVRREVGMPAPDAIKRSTHQDESLWLEHRMPEIVAWYTAREKARSDRALARAEEALDRALRHVAKLKAAASAE